MTKLTVTCRHSEKAPKCVNVGYISTQPYVLMAQYFTKPRDCLTSPTVGNNE